MKSVYTTFYVLILSLVFICTGLSQTNIIINEFSQGDPGTNHEWIEFVVTADNTNIQGVYYDKDDDFNTNGNRWDDIAFQFSTTYAPFSNVSKGAVIVIYRNADGGNKDPVLPADDIVFTDDNVIVIPHTDTNGFLEAGARWPALLGGGDAFGLFNSDGSGIHGIAYGADGMNWSSTWSTAFPPGTSWGITDLTLTVVGSGRSIFFTESLPAVVNVAGNWSDQASSSATPSNLNGGNNNSLPVELVSFSALTMNSAVQLNWTTSTEVMNYGFDVERLGEGNDWITLGFVEGNGNSNSPKEYSFLDSDISGSGNYSYRLKQIDNDGSYEYSKVINIDFDSPMTFELKQNFPNPFNPSTTINFNLQNSEFVTLKIFNTIGEEVEKLVEGNLEAGVHSFNFNATDLPSGLYVYKLTANNQTQTRKMLLMK